MYQKSLENRVLEKWKLIGMEDIYENISSCDDEYVNDVEESMVNEPNDALCS